MTGRATTPGGSSRAGCGARAAVERLAGYGRAAVAGGAAVGSGSDGRRARGAADASGRAGGCGSARRATPAGGTYRRLLLLGGALAARAVLREVRSLPAAPSLERVNFRGRTVTLAGGPALAVGASASAALGAGSPATAAAALTAGLGAGAVGLYDDVVGARPEQKSYKGFQGHLRALRDRRVTSGLVKIVGVGAAGLAASVLLSADRRARSGRAPGAFRRSPAGAARDGSTLGAVTDVLLGAGVIAGTANLVNLLDLRPGRALKAGVLAGAPLIDGPAGGLVAGPVGAAAGLLPADLGEEIMLGDCGANAFGALLGVAFAARTGPIGRAVILAAVGALTAASEKVSFTAVIERTAGLRELDALGRRRD